MNIFEEAAIEYDGWFETHEWVYQSEVAAVRKFIPETGKGIEIGVGTGRFSVPFGINISIDPAYEMAKITKVRDIHVCRAKAEYLPFKDNSFDFVLMVTTLCFLENPSEIQRLEPIEEGFGKGLFVVISAGVMK